MKAFKLTGIRKMKLVSVPNPEIVSDYDVLIRMKTVGVCGSDIHYYATGKIGSQIVKYPFTVGHEGAGEVLKTGARVSRVKPGDKVAIDPAMPCYECDQCKAGRTHTCSNLSFLGTPGQAEGCLSEYIVMPEKSLFPVSYKLSYDDCALSEPLSIGYYAVKQAGPPEDASVGILGFGPIGMSVLLSSEILGGKDFFVTDKIDDRLELAKKSGTSYTGNPLKTNIVEDIQKHCRNLLDVVYECCGQQEAMNQAVDLLKPGGKLMIIGIPEADFWKFSVDKLRHKEITIVNVRRQNECVQAVLDLIETGQTDVSKMITHRFSFSDTQKAFDLVSDYSDGVMKAMIDF
jgi:L-iditol 2-dehydrogenase